MQRPYLVDRALEPAGLANAGAHQRLVDASAKLRLLHFMLPELKARGRWVLLFSQVGSCILGSVAVAMNDNFCPVFGSSLLL